MFAAVNYARKLGIDPEPLSGKAEAMRGEGKTVMFVALEGRLAGLVAVADPIKAGAAEAVRSLMEADIAVVMATGDSPATAKAGTKRLIAPR